MPMIKELVNKIRENNYGRREFEVTLLSTPDHYLFSEAEIKSVYYNLIKHIKYKYKVKKIRLLFTNY